MDVVGRVDEILQFVFYHHPTCSTFLAVAGDRLLDSIVVGLAINVLKINIFEIKWKFIYLKSIS